MGAEPCSVNLNHRTVRFPPFDYFVRMVRHRQEIGKCGWGPYESQSQRLGFNRMGWLY